MESPARLFVTILAVGLCAGQTPSASPTITLGDVDLRLGMPKKEVLAKLSNQHPQAQAASVDRWSIFGNAPAFIEFEQGRLSKVEAERPASNSADTVETVNSLFRALAVETKAAPQTVLIETEESNEPISGNEYRIHFIKFQFRDGRQITLHLSELIGRPKRVLNTTDPVRSMVSIYESLLPAPAHPAPIGR